jgi:hypothetical protein
VKRNQITFGRHFADFQMAAMKQHDKKLKSSLINQSQLEGETA